MAANADPLHLHMRETHHLTTGRRPSRFKPVRFQEYRIQWGGVTSAASVSDVYVLLPDRCALTAAAAVASETGGAASVAPLCTRLPEDADLRIIATKAAAGLASATSCDCQRHCLGPSPTMVMEATTAGGDLGRRSTVWTRQIFGCHHVERCTRRANKTRTCCHSGAAASEAAPAHYQSNSAPPPPPPPPLLGPQVALTPPFDPPIRSLALQPPKSPEQNKLPSNPPTSPAELSLTTSISASPPLLQLPPPQPSPLQKQPMQQRPSSPTHPEFDRVEACAETCVATLAQMLQGVLLAAVRAETEPLERMLAEKEAELCRLRWELRERDDRLRRMHQQMLPPRHLVLPLQQAADSIGNGSGHSNGSGTANDGKGGGSGGAGVGVTGRIGERNFADILPGTATLSPN